MTGSSETQKTGMIGAAFLGLSYVGMLASLFTLNSYTLIFLLPASGLCLLIGVVIWALSVKKDLFQKGVL